MNLEDKIREALPQLNELTKGCLISVKEYPNEIIELCTDEYPDKTFGISLENKFITIDFEDAWGSHNTATYNKTIGHPVKLNDVLEYLLYVRLYSPEDKQIIRVLNIWNFSSVFFADQNEKLKEFLNDL